MESFKEIINGDKPVLIDFYATWCAPCKAMSPIIETIGKEMHSQIRVLKIDIDKNPALAQQLQIQAVPTLVVFMFGKIVWRKSGALDKYTLTNEIKKFL